MATALENLKTARDNVAAQLADITANPKPSYSSGDRSVSWTEHFKALTEKYAELNNLIAAQEPFEIVTQGSFP